MLDGLGGELLCLSGEAEGGDVEGAVGGEVDAEAVGGVVGAGDDDGGSGAGSALHFGDGGVVAGVVAGGADPEHGGPAVEHPAGGAGGEGVGPAAGVEHAGDPVMVPVSMSSQLSTMSTPSRSATWSCEVVADDFDPEGSFGSEGEFGDHGAGQGPAGVGVAGEGHDPVGLEVDEDVGGA